MSQAFSLTTSSLEMSFVKSSQQVETELKSFYINVMILCIIFSITFHQFSSIKVLKDCCQLVKFFVIHFRKKNDFKIKTYFEGVKISRFARFH